MTPSLRHSLPVPCSLQDSPEFKRWQARRHTRHARQYALWGAAATVLIALGTAILLHHRHAADRIDPHVAMRRGLQQHPSFLRCALSRMHATPCVGPWRINIHAKSDKIKRMHVTGRHTGAEKAQVFSAERPQQPVAPPAAHAVTPAPSDSRSETRNQELISLRHRLEAAEQAAAEARTAAADAAARHESALLEERRRSSAAIAAAEQILRRQAAELVAQHQAALQEERVRSAAASEAAVAPLRERLAADATAHETALRTEREKVAAAVEAATAPLRHRVEALHEASTRAAALVRSLQQSSGAGASAGQALPYAYEGDAPLWVARKVSDCCRRVYDAALGLSREQRLAAGMVGCLAMQLLLIWLLRRFGDTEQEVRLRLPST